MPKRRAEWAPADRRALQRQHDRFGRASVDGGNANGLQQLKNDGRQIRQAEIDASLEEASYHAS